MSSPRTLSAYLSFTFFLGFTVSLPTALLNPPSLSLIQDPPALELSQATNVSLPTSEKSIQNLGDTKAVITNIGFIRQDLGLPITRVKRDVPLSPLVQSFSGSAVTGAVNASTLSLPTADEFPIPDSDYSLYLGNLGPQLHPWDLETLLIAVSAAIEEQITAHGRTARLPSTEYSMRLAGLQLWIQRMPWDTVNLAWAELAIIVDGLWLYIVNGRHDREAFIDVINHVTGKQVALGWIGKPHVPLEPTASTGIIRRGLDRLASRQIS